MADFYVFKKREEYDDYGQIIECFEWEVAFYCPCAVSYPESKSGVTGQISDVNGIEVVQYYQIVYIEMCNCKCTDLCHLDFRPGDYAYVNNKYWKIKVTTDIDDCGCHILKFILERLEPRENVKKLIECMSCFQGGCE